MNKIPTLFRRDPADMKRVLPEVNPECQWVIDGEGVATRKYDGTCVMFDGEHWWARREVKRDAVPPTNYVPISIDLNTGKTMGWEPIGQSSFAKFHAEALGASDRNLTPGTFELIGARINKNPEAVPSGHLLVRHEYAALLPGAPRDYDALHAYLAEFDGEGIVWHHPDGRMAKLKRRDFI
jgi:hypothetical protein